MISVYAFPLFLWIFLAMQVPTQGTITKLTNVKRIDLGDEFELSAEFEGDPTVEIKWRRIANGQVETLQGSEVENGKATLKIAKTETIGASVYLDLGDRHTHDVSFTWNLNGDGDQFSTKECPLLVITPGLDLTYVPNQTLEVKIAFEEERGPSDMVLIHKTPPMYGYVWNETTNRIVYGASFDFCEQSHESQNGVSTTTLTFRAADDEAIIGYFDGFFRAYPADRKKSPILSMSERFNLAVHREDGWMPY